MKGRSFGQVIKIILEVILGNTSMRVKTWDREGKKAKKKKKCVTKQVNTVGSGSLIPLGSPGKT